ncbi:hypothetical protein OCU04_000560 [Sclerotinia nivalis]|uniref:Cytochrome P450 n=1 Tax=Sclerotinia nivalis TaxID=352851 RepID=A0A9X0AZP7_9HELO|nr:hypothetical protein OCU04_000560 [Sclerotinia nivalis]
MLFFKLQNPLILIQASGADWQRQRKVTGTQFNEQNSGTVWIEALKQADEVWEFWKSLPTPIRRTHKDTLALSLHVLSALVLASRIHLESGGASEARSFVQLSGFVGFDS